MKYIKLYEAYNVVESIFPSEEFEREIGMDGLSEEYFLPKGYDYHKIYNLLRRERGESERVEKLYYRIVKLNPELEAITIYDYGSIYTTLQGICSKFLIQDIIWFDKLFNYDRRKILEYNSEVEPYKMWIYKKTGAKMGWVPCPDTLEKVLKYVKKNYK